MGKCSHYNSLVDTPHGVATVGRLYENGKPFDVWSWNGEEIVRARASAPWKLPDPEPCVELSLGDHLVTIALRHRVLGEDGSWHYVDKLLKCGAFRLPTTAALGRRAHDVSGPHSRRTALDYPDGCSEDLHRYGERLLLGADIVRVSSPSQGGALRPDAVLCSGDDQAGICTDTLRRFCSRPANWDVLDRLWALVVEFLSRIQNSIAQQSADRYPISLPFLVGSPLQPRSGAGSRLSGLDRWPRAVLGVNYVGRQDVFDFEVEGTRCYLGGGLIHHNSFGVGGYETALHLTGLYPHWWEGKRFDRPMIAWAAGTKSLKVRDVNQRILLGDLKQVRGITTATGGLIPNRAVGRIARKTGVTDAVDKVMIRHRLGFENKLTFHSYEEGRTAFEAEAVDWIWLDEEPPKPIYDECMMRLLTTKGSIISTLTPVEGMTATVQALLEGTSFL